jgi:hypothetical protein
MRQLPKQVETKEGAAGAEQSSQETVTETGVSDYGVTDLVNLCPKHCPAAYKQEVAAAVAATGKDDDPLSLAGKLVRWKTVVPAAESVSSKGRKRPRSSALTTVTKEGRVTWYNPVLQRYCTVVGLLPTGSSSSSSTATSSDSTTTAAAAGAAAAGGAGGAGSSGSADKGSVSATSMEDVEVFWLDLQQLAEATIVLPTAKPKHRYVCTVVYDHIHTFVFF